MTARDRDPPALPAGLRARVLQASLRARAVGRPVPAAPVISSTEAFRRAADAFYGLLCALPDEDWRRPALRGLDVQGLVGHLTGVEEDVQRCLAGDAGVAGAGHVESTQPAADRQAGCPPAQTRAEWRRAADRTLDLVRAGRSPRAKVAVHGLRLPVHALLVTRAFELWTHENDIRRAVGRPPSVPGPSALRLMTGLAVRLLPRAAARAGLRAPLNLHLVLTGPGGGTWNLLVGQSPADPGPATPGPADPVPVGPGPVGPVPVGIVTDAVGFCRLAANRITPAQLDPHITGDVGHAAGVLAVIPALALD